MKMTAKVSVVVPVYNGERSVASCLDNLTKQSLKEIEIICVNDGSTDNSLEVINDYIKKDPRIRVVSQKNGGLSAARNTGLRNVKTPFVMFCDCDDIFDDEMCEKMVGAMVENDVDIVACGTEVEYKAHSEIAESDSNYYRIKFSGKNYINEEITSRTDVSVCDKIFKVELINKHGIKFPEGLNNEDYYFYNAYMSISDTILFITKKMYKYIRHEDSIMSDNFNSNKYSPDHLLIVQELFSFYKKNGFLDRHVDYFWNQFAESYWFSYSHSAKKHHKKIQAIANKFIDKQLPKYPVTKSKVRHQINIIRHNNLFYKIMRFMKAKLRGLYRKVNIAYRQQEFINIELDNMIARHEELLEKVKKIESIIEEK